MQPTDSAPPSSLGRMVAGHPVVAFVALSYTFSWSLYVPMIIKNTIIPPLIVFATFGPTLAAMITHRITAGNWWPFHIVSTWPRVIAGTVSGFVLIVLTYVILPAIIATDPGR